MTLYLSLQYRNMDRSLLLMQWGYRKNLQYQSNFSTCPILLKVVLATVLFGIAATLLSNRRLHSRCKIPICVVNMCSISLRDTVSPLLRQTDLLVIDEMSMGHEYILEAIDIRGKNSLFGDCVDIRRLAPKSSCCPPWLKTANSQCSSHVIISEGPCQTINLTRNMRVILTDESAAFLDYLLSVRNEQQNVCKEIRNFAMPLPE